MKKSIFYSVFIFVLLMAFSQTSAAKASRNALAGTHCPLAKNPCKNNTFLIACKGMK